MISANGLAGGLAALPQPAAKAAPDAKTVEEGGQSDGFAELLSGLLAGGAAPAAAFGARTGTGEPVGVPIEGDSSRSSSRHELNDFGLGALAQSDAAGGTLEGMQASLPSALAQIAATLDPRLPLGAGMEASLEPVELQARISQPGAGETGAHGPAGTDLRRRLEIEAATAGGRPAAQASADTFSVVGRETHFAVVPVAGALRSASPGAGPIGSGTAARSPAAARHAAAADAVAGPGGDPAQGSILAGDVAGGEEGAAARPQAGPPHSGAGTQEDIARPGDGEQTPVRPVERHADASRATRAAPGADAPETDRDTGRVLAPVASVVSGGETEASLQDALPAGLPSSQLRQIADRIAEAAPSTAPAGAAGHDRPVAPAPVKVLTIQLQPVELGNIVVRMTVRNDALEVQIAADRQETARLLQQDRDALSKLLQANGVQTDGVAVIARGPDTFAASSNTAQSFSHFSPQHQSGSGFAQSEARSSGRQQHGSREERNPDANRKVNDEIGRVRTGSSLYV